MANAKDSAFKKLENNLFKSSVEVAALLSPAELERKKRTMLCVSKKIEDPLISDADLVTFLEAGGEGAFKPVSKTTAYRDIATVGRICGNIKLASKAWYRYMIIEGAKKGYAIAVNMNDAKGVAANLDKIGKYTMADKEDNDFDFDSMTPPSWEPTDKVGVLGEEFTEISEQERNDFRALFRIYAKDAEDIESEEIGDDSTS